MARASEMHTAAAHTVVINYIKLNTQLKISYPLKLLNIFYERLYLSLPLSPKILSFIIWVEKREREINC